MDQSSGMAARSDELNAFERRVERLRDRISAHSVALDLFRREWDEICADHQAHLAALGGNAGVTRRLIEDLRFDFDVLVHDLYRFADRHR